MRIIRSHLARTAAITIIVILYGLSRLPELPASERTRLASSFGFTNVPLYEPANFEYRTIRQVQPDLEHIAGWLSGIGAAVALNDLDGDGLANDVCHVDPRIDRVIISPAPGTPERYQPFVLAHAGVPYRPVSMAPIGCIPNDMNEDGRMDLLIYYWGRTPLAFLNNGAISLTGDSYTPHEILPGDDVWWSSAGTFADFDGDGHVDLLITNYFPDDTSLLLGSKADRLINMHHSMSRAFNGGGTHLFLWQAATTGAHPTVNFRKVEGVFAEEVTHAFTLAVGAADLDGDLLPEIYFANDFGPDRLLHNRSRPGALNFAVLEGEKFFTTPNSRVIGHDSFKGMGVDFGDLNDDGLFDIYVSNIAADYALHESHFMFLSTGEIEQMQTGIAPYIDQGERLGVSRSGWGWESRLADFNNDSVLEAIQATGFMKGEASRWPELQEMALVNDELTANPGNWPNLEAGDELNGYDHNPFYVRSVSGRFFDLAPELGLDLPQVSRGIATADVDGDGDLDFAVANQWETSHFYRNDCPNCAAFLGLHLLLPAQNSHASADVIRPGHPGADTPGRPAIGAVAKVQLPDGRQLIGLVDGGNGQAGERSSDLHFGLGQLDAGVQLAVELQWRDVDGHVNQKTVQLTPGWHTLLLANERIVSK
ncbi:MAG: RNA-binding protein [Anaerolineae bacterium]|nr:RNA-binding protein [Anaerolineae bacterium]